MIYENMKGKAYDVLAVCGFDHETAKMHGFDDGWQRMMSDTEDTKFGMFMMCLPTASGMSDKQRQCLLDGLAREYAGCKNWMEFVDQECEDK